MVSFIALFSGCTLRGYQIDLSASGPNELFLSLKNVLIEKGFETNQNPERVYNEKGGIVERYQKDFGNMSRTFFDRKTDYSVDIFHRGCKENYNSKCEIDVFIYNVYIGNDPKRKPVLIREADYIEDFLLKSVPDARISRSEHLTGIPLI